MFEEKSIPANTADRLPGARGASLDDTAARLFDLAIHTPEHFDLFWRMAEEYQSRAQMLRPQRTA